jgi:hypothetical protein
MLTKLIVLSEYYCSLYKITKIAIPGINVQTRNCKNRSTSQVFTNENKIFLQFWVCRLLTILGCCSGGCGPGEWGVREVGCEACLCSVLGSLGPACDPASGQCSCRPGYTGHKCNICPGGHAQKFGKTSVVDADQIGRLNGPGFGIAALGEPKK